MSRFSLTSLQTLISQALSTSEQQIAVRLSNTGNAVTSAPFITINIASTTPPGLPQRRQINENTEQVSEDRIALISVQAFGAGAMTILFRLRAWLGSSMGMLELKKIGVSSPTAEEPKDISAAVSTGFEERSVMNMTLSYTDVYQIEQDTIAEVPISIITDNPPSEIDFTVKN